MKPVQDLRQFSEWYDKGFAHYLVCLHTPDKMSRCYPTRDTHTEEQEADFILGYGTAKAQADAAMTVEDYGDGMVFLDGY